MEEITNTKCYHEATIIGQDGLARTLQVPVVQELARHGVQAPPKMFIHSPSASLATSSISCSPDNFPSISLAKLRATKLEERQIELEKLANGAREWGMVLVNDHGVPISLLNDVKNVVKGFFSLSFEDKKRCVGTYASVDNMGYGRNFVKSEDQVLEWIDRLTMMAAPKGSTDGLNVWPQTPPNFREVIESYAEEARKLGNELLQGLAEALTLDKNAFLKYFDPKTSEIKVRINHYPPCPNPNLTLGLNPHTDASALSLLIQFDASGGLQVMHKDKQIWVSVPWPVDSLLVNVGDLLEIMSNGRVKSPWHRVVTQSHVERCSLALFYNPSSLTEIEPVERDDSDEKYKKVVVGEYVQHFCKVSPSPFKQAIKFAMI